MPKNEKENNFNVNEFINNYNKNNENDIQILKSFKTPLYYSILNNSFECFVLLFDFYPKNYVSEVFTQIENTSKLNRKNCYSISLIEKYINFFKINENKMFVDKENSELYLISEKLLFTFEILKDKNNIYIKNILSFLISNPENFDINTFCVKPLLKSSSKIQTFLIFYLLISVFKIYPKSNIFNIFVSTKDLINEDVLIFIIFLIEKEGFKLLNIEKYFSSEELLNNISKDIEKINSMKNYDLFINDKNNNNELENLSLILEKDPILILKNCCYFGYYKIGNLIINEFNLLNQLNTFSEKEKELTKNIFLSFKNLFIYNFNNFEKIKEIIENAEINAYERQQNSLEKIKIKEDLNEDFYENLSEIKPEVNDVFNGLDNNNNFDRFLFSIYSNKFTIFSLNSTIKFLSFIFEPVNLLISNIQTNEKNIKNLFEFNNFINDFQEDLLFYRRFINEILIDKKEIKYYFNNNSQEKVFDYLINNFDFKQIFEIIYEFYTNETILKRKLLPKFIINYYEYYFNNENIKSSSENINKIEIPYLKYFNLVHNYVSF